MRLAEMDYPLDTLVPQIWELLEPYLCEPLVSVPTEKWRTGNGTFDSLAQSTVVDALPELWARSMDRASLMQFSYPVVQSRALFIVPSQRAVADDSSWFSLHNALSVFSPPVWFSIASLVCLSAAINSRIGHPQGKSPHRHFTLWTWIAHFCLQNTKTPYLPWASYNVRPIIILTGLLSMHCLSLYQGCLLTQLVRQDPYKPEISAYEDVIELIQSKQAVLNLINPSFIFPTLMREKLRLNQSSRYMSGLDQALDVNPPVFLDLRRNGEELQRLIDDGVKVITVQSELYTWFSMDRHNCEILSIPTSDVFTFALALSAKTHPRTLRCLNQAIMQNFDYITGIIDDFGGRRERQYAECRQDMFMEQTTSTGDPIRLVRLSGTFTILFAGAILAAVCFVVEHIRRRVGDRLRKSESRNDILRH